LEHPFMAFYKALLLRRLRNSIPVILLMETILFSARFHNVSYLSVSLILISYIRFIQPQ